MDHRVNRREFLRNGIGVAAMGVACCARGAVPATQPAPFYVRANDRYSIFDSAADSLRFTLTRCMTSFRGHACATSSFVDPEGAIMGWHDFGTLEGPGWAANAAGGAYELIGWARFTGNAEMEKTALSVLDHVLENGFIHRASGFIRGYRHVPRNEFVLNFKHNNDWFCPGSTAKVAVQLLLCSDQDEKTPRAAQGGRQGLRRLDRPASAGCEQRLVSPPPHGGRRGLRKVGRRRKRPISDQQRRRPVHPATVGGTDGARRSATTGRSSPAPPAHSWIPGGSMRASTTTRTMHMKTSPTRSRSVFCAAPARC